MPSSEIRVIFDCNIFVQALLNPNGIAGECKKLFDHEKITLFISPAIITEISEVLSRPNFRRFSPNVTDERITAFLDDIVARAIPIMNVPEEFSYERDPKDSPYINLALVTSAAYLVSRDKDLLDLMNEQSPVGKAFRHRFPFLFILDPVSFVKEIKGLES